MKPIKNRVFCYECKRAKMLFESEDKALRFIRFNADAFEEKCPTRVYYCNACCGWHVTSRQGESYENPLVENTIQLYHNNSRRLGGTYGGETTRYIDIIRTTVGEIRKKRNTRKFKLENIKKAVSRMNDAYEAIYKSLIESDRNQIYEMVKEVNSILEELKENKDTMI